MTFVDTNYFLRFLLDDNRDQGRRAGKLFEDSALGKERLMTSIIVIFEIHWVLTSFYQRNKHAVISVLSDIMKMDFIKITERDLLNNAISIYKSSNLDLEDAYNLSFAMKNRVLEFKTFDQRLMKEFNKQTK
jgi:predicted nucleic-acid-binding protein